MPKKQKRGGGDDETRSSSKRGRKSAAKVPPEESPADGAAAAAAVLEPMQMPAPVAPPPPSSASSSRSRTPARGGGGGGSDDDDSSLNSSGDEDGQSTPPAVRVRSKKVKVDGRTVPRDPNSTEKPKTKYTMADLRKFEKHYRPERRYARVRWTPIEVAALKLAVRRHGTGHWSAIKDDPDFSELLSARTSIDIKDKWRNMIRTLQRHRAASGFWET